MILAGDIGGTKTRLAFFDDRLEVVAERRFVSRDYASLDDIVVEFTAGTERKPDRACFGLAGAVKEGRSKTTNLPWIVDARQLGEKLGTRRVALINDLEANAWGIGGLSAGDFAPLKEGTPLREGDQAVISAGTGLGEAGLVWDGRMHRPFPSEGGHASFAPRNELEIDLLRYLMKEFGVVSWERVLSGPGLFNVYRFLRDTGRGEEPAWLTEQFKKDDKAAAISQAALSHSSPLCEKALELFVALYGAEAGNLALKLFATGGVYLGGGIAPKILDWLRSPAFVEAFLDKGPMREKLLVAIPVQVILNEKTALLGAARFAALAMQD